METLEVEGKHSHYQYEIWSYPHDDYPDTKCFYYKILDKGGMAHYWTGDPVISESDQYFDTSKEAEFAAIGHISTLEDGKEPDYDKEPASIDWDERRKLGE